MNINDECVGVIGVYQHKIKIVGYGIYKGVRPTPGIDDKRKIYSQVHKYIEEEPYMQMKNGSIHSSRNVRIISVEEFKEIKYATKDIYGKVNVEVTDAFYTPRNGDNN